MCTLNILIVLSARLLHAAILLSANALMHSHEITNVRMQVHELRYNAGCSFKKVASEFFHWTGTSFFCK